MPNRRECDPSCSHPCVLPSCPPPNKDCCRPNAPNAMRPTLGSLSGAPHLNAPSKGPTYSQPTCMWGVGGRGTHKQTAQEPCSPPTEVRLWSPSLPLVQLHSLHSKGGRDSHPLCSQEPRRPAVSPPLPPPPLPQYNHSPAFCRARAPRSSSTSRRPKTIQGISGRSHPPAPGTTEAAPEPEGAGTARVPARAVAARTGGGGEGALRCHSTGPAAIQRRNLPGVFIDGGAERSEAGDPGAPWGRKGAALCSVGRVPSHALGGILLLPVAVSEGSSL